RALAGVADQRLMPTMQAVESSDAYHAALRAEVLARDVPEQLAHGESIAAKPLNSPQIPHAEAHRVLHGGEGRGTAADQHGDAHGADPEVDVPVGPQPTAGDQHHRPA